jgi:hypothetical protein
LPLFHVSQGDGRRLSHESSRSDGGFSLAHRRITRLDVFVDSKAPWFEITDGLPQFSEKLAAS